MNFNIIENHNPYSDIIKDFADDYNSRELYAYELREKYHLNANSFRNIRKQALKQGLINNRRYVCKKNIPKNYYYHKTNHVWCVVKNINHERVYFGGYKTEEEAQLIVEELKKCNWDKSKLRSIKFKVLCTKLEKK